MKIVSLVLTYLVGLVFFGFGLAYFFHLMPTPPMTGDPLKYMEVMGGSGYMNVVKVLEVVFGAMLLANFKRPLAWLLLLPIIVNIAMYEVFIAKAPGIGILLLVINAFMIYVNRDSYKSLVA
jgi:putative oxidoreductase